MQFDGNNEVSKCDHPRRMLCIEKELIQPREEGAKVGAINKSSEPFSVRAKPFWDVTQTRMILESYMPKLCHETDGLIFNPANEEYMTGQCDNLLKWKPHELNSVDFKLRIMERHGEG
jgi:mRNA-capping enzyme